MKIKSKIRKINCCRILSEKKRRLLVNFVKVFFKKKDSKLFSNSVPKTKQKTRNILPLSTTFSKTSRKWLISKKTTWSRSPKTSKKSSPSKKNKIPSKPKNIEINKLLSGKHRITWTKKPNSKNKSKISLQLLPRTLKSKKINWNPHFPDISRTRSKSPFKQCKKKKQSYLRKNSKN